MAGGAEQTHGLIQRKVRGPRQPVESVEQATGVLHNLQCLREFAEGLDSRVTDAWWTPVLRVGAAG
ncbi:hypothetical protein GCM10009670_02190 [Citricoccus alkalitolerans]